jgi:hypothetical protein
MGLAADMKILSEELLASFKQRIKENEELVNDVQQTLDGFRKDHQEMAAILNANAKALRENLATGEKERMNTYNDLMAGINQTIMSIRNEVSAIQTSTLNMISEFNIERMKMAEVLKQLFAQNRAERTEDEKERMKEFDALMTSISNDINRINTEVADIFTETNQLIERFDKEHREMSAELRADLSKNLTQRVAYTRNLLGSFQKRLAEISRENQDIARKLRKDLANGETTRLNEYKGLMKAIHLSIKGIQKEVKDIRKSTAGMIGDLSTDRAQATAEWIRMQDAMAKIRGTKTGKNPVKQTVKSEKKEVKPVIQQEPETKFITKEEPVSTPVSNEPVTLEQKVLNYINQHPKGLKISEMEEPLGETRMKLGYTAKVLLDEGKVQKIDNVYFPLK